MKLNIRKKFIRLHLLLGLVSGIIIFIVCITGSLYVFRDEINDFTQPWKFITAEDKPLLLPEEILQIAAREVPDVQSWAITYGESTDAVFVDYFDKEGIFVIFINPYTGEVIKKVHKPAGQFDFFHFVLRGHRTLWLPRGIGKPLVGWGVTLFAITLLTGLFLWLPRRWNRINIRCAFKIKKTGSFARFNFDLHNVLGFYASFLLLVLCFTGLIWSFRWFSEMVYSVTSGGKELKPYTLPKSVLPGEIPENTAVLNSLYLHLKAAEPDAATFYFALPPTESDVIRVSIVHKRGSYYQTDNLFFDQYILTPLEGTGPYAGKYREASAADKFRRMNLEIHDGRILGLFGKILMFFASLIGASLPVTGIYIWYRKKWKI